MPVVDLTSMIIGNHIQAFVIQWYFVPGYRDAYCVGSDGSLWSRYVQIGREWLVGGVDDWRKMLPATNDSGYLYTVLSLDGVATTVRVHQLVADAFLGPCSLGLECCHEDGNSQNNDVVNLRYDTRKNNQNDRFKHGTDNRGERGPNGFLTQDAVDLIREDYATGKYTQEQLGERHGVVGSSISQIVRNKAWFDENFIALDFTQEHAVRGEEHGRSKLNWAKVDLIREEFATGKYTQKQLGERHGVDKTNISYIVRDKTWVRRTA